MAVSIQDIRHFVMALTLSSDYGFSASLDLIGARRSSWALSLWGLSGIRSQGLSGLRSTHYYAPIRDPGGPTGPISGHTVYSVLRTHQGHTEGGLGGDWREISYKKNPPKGDRIQ